MSKEQIPKTLASFRIKDNYLKTFRSACKLAGVRMSDIIESFMFKYLQEFDQIMEEEDSVKGIEERIKDHVQKVNQQAEAFFEKESKLNAGVTEE